MDAKARTLQGGYGMITESIILNVLSILAIGWYVAGAILFLPIGQWIRRDCKKCGKEQANEDVEKEGRRND